MSVLLQLTGVIVDLIYRVDAVPAAGTEAVVRDATLSAGGGFNAMVAARRAGMRVNYGGSIGSGPLADIVQQALAREGIDILQTPKPWLDQGCCTVLVDAAGERTFIAMTGAESHLAAGDLPSQSAAVADWALVSGYSLVYPDSRQAVISQIEALPDSVQLLFDPGPLVEQIPADLLRRMLGRSDWVSCNAVEAASLGAGNRPQQAAVQLARDRPARGGAVVRVGAEGCVCAASGKTAQSVPGHAVQVVDTNGAGDAHVGGFIAARARGLSVVEACHLANASAALATTLAGPATAPSLQEVENWLGTQASSNR